MSVQTYNSSVRDRRRAGCLSVLSALAMLAPAASTAAIAVDPSASATGTGSARIPRGDDALRSRADRQISMDEAIDLAQRRYNARVVRAEVSDRGGRRVYLLRLLSDDGRVFNVRVDAATGSIQ